jgi:phosphoserine phosphatase RsbU/P
VAFLKVIKGSCPGQILELIGPRTVVGRHPNCEIVLDNAAVSRHHAQILENHGVYYLEDLRSRNRTYLNKLPVEGRTELHESDTIKVCDVVFRFHLRIPAGDEPGSDSDSVVQTPRNLSSGDGTPPQRRTDALQDAVFEQDDEDESADAGADTLEDSSSILSTLDVRSTTDLRLNVKPEIKLRAVLGIGKALANLLRLEDVLQTILDRLFEIFPQADAGFVLLQDSRKRKLTVRAHAVSTAARTKIEAAGGTVELLER